jgi:hypothetical protein
MREAPSLQRTGVRWVGARKLRRVASTSLRGVPKAAWICALVALANGLAWSLIVPPFQVPDENAHYAYVAQVAERGTLPRQIPIEGHLSPREDATLSTIGFFWMTGKPEDPAPFSDLQGQLLDRIEAQRLSARGTGDALTATNNPPLYYALQAIPYKLAPGGTVLSRLALMRVLSALMGALTVLLVFLFLRELLPARAWAWSTGALLAAFQPMFGFMSGGVNNDNLLYLAATGVLWSLARAFRRGLDTRGGLLIGAFLGLGLVAKLTLLGFVPAVALALLLLMRRAWRGGVASDRAVEGAAVDSAGVERDRSPNGPVNSDRVERDRALRGAAVAGAVAAAPMVVYVVLNHLVWKRVVIPGGVGSVHSAVAGRAFDFREELSHIWQLFLPSIGMHRQFADLPLWQTWFKGLVGRFGWLDYGFPAWVYRAALAIAVVVLVLAAVEIVRRRHALARRLDELAVYVLALAGLCAEIGVESYRAYIQNGERFEQPRYLLPAIGLYAALGVLAVRGGGRRWGPVLAAGLVTLAIGHDLYAQAITIARYYA